jgi:hypothetical protein
MKLAQNIHEVMKRGAQRRDLFLLKTNDCSYRTEEWLEIGKLKFS